MVDFPALDRPHRTRRSAVRGWWLAVVAALALTGLACTGADGSGVAGGDPSPVGGRSDLPASMAALGDSISTGFGSCLALASCPRNSWSTGDGTLVNSHYRRLVAANPAARGQVRNFAEPGAVAADLPGQASAAVGTRPAYVTILIGANDACRGDIDEMTPVRDFRGSLDEALGTLRRALPDTRVLIVSIPDVYQVWQAGHTNRTAVQVWGFGVCPALLANPTSTAAADVARRARFRQRVEAYDTQLAAACAGYGAKCHYDGGAVHRVAFTSDELSALDFFHPNAAGQDRLAQVSWYLT